MEGFRRLVLGMEVLGFRIGVGEDGHVTEALILSVVDVNKLFLLFLSCCELMGMFSGAAWVINGRDVCEMGDVFEGLFDFSLHDDSAKSFVFEKVSEIGRVTLFLAGILALL